MAVLDEILYNALGNYFHALSKLGYMSFPNMEKLLILAFYRDFVYEDYRGYLDKEAYHIIERALNCLWGSTCSIPYPDYLKMGKLHLGEMSEMAARLQALEETPVLKLTDPLNDLENMEAAGDVCVLETE